MCLYETKLTNVKYLPNKKNKGIAPTISDYRQNTISVGCGWCEECRKKIANDWRIRLYEEIKSNKHCEFVTLSFSPAALEKLETEMYGKAWHGLQPNEDGEILTDVNNLAGYAIRMWSERWRKHNKSAPRHWLITELGHKNSERLHLHGLIWGTKEMIEKTWQYGNTYCGEYVNERTINYIVKYVTKLDNYHKGYKQKIFASKGIGKCYIDKTKIHKYRDSDTITYYKTHNGHRLGLPRYYKEKLWTEEEREKLWTIKLDEGKVYLKNECYNTMDDTSTAIKDFDKALEGARETNNLAGYGNNESGNRTYIITDLMKMEKKDAINYDKEKLVQSIQKREIDKIIPYEETNDISKAKNHDTIYYYKYIGNTTEAQRNYNILLEDAKKLKISVRKLRLIKEGIVSFNSQVPVKQQIELGEKLITLLKKKYEKT